jgi:hypothetical protein
VDRDELVARVRGGVEAEVRAYLEQQPLSQVVSLDWMEALVRALLAALATALFGVWMEVINRLALQIARDCPRCGQARKCKRRADGPMEIGVLGLGISLPKLYLECGRCKGSGLSVTKLLTGLCSGETSAELELRAAYLGAEQSYGKASRDLCVHYGETVERTKVRRMALEVEGQALLYAEAQRVEQLKRMEQEQRTVGPPRLMLQGDGGTVRTGTLVPSEPGDPGYGKKTANRALPRRKRNTQYRELITLDVREPGQVDPRALDIVVPVVAPEGERARRMLALAARAGLGDNTEVYGLGDMGSSLATSFDEAFVGHAALYSADWKHTCDYVEHAAAVLNGDSPERWPKEMKDALWNRERARADELIVQARDRRVAELPTQLQKCPVATLATYVDNNWERLHAKAFKELKLDYVSARAESQVRDRTKGRYAVPGAWNQNNLEGKATLRAIIADGRWPSFREHYLRIRHDDFNRNLALRLRTAVAEGRLHADCLSRFKLGTTDVEVPAAAA